jgi:hypothetical protein
MLGHNPAFLSLSPTRKCECYFTTSARGPHDPLVDMLVLCHIFLMIALPTPTGNRSWREPASTQR